VSLCSLKSCPFCRGKDEDDSLDIEWETEGGGRAAAWWWVECDCGARGPLAETSDAARVLWNQRA